MSSKGGEERRGTPSYVQDLIGATERLSTLAEHLQDRGFHAKGAQVFKTCITPILEAFAAVTPPLQPCT
jgi:hypothetical protein